MPEGDEEHAEEGWRRAGMECCEADEAGELPSLFPEMTDP